MNTTTYTVLRSPLRMCALGQSKNVFGPGKSAVFGGQMATYTSDSGDSSSLSQLAISKDEEHIVSLVSSIPRDQAPLGPSQERFRIYETAVQVYKAARRSGRLQQTIEDRLDSDRQLKQRIYQLVFEVLHYREVITEMLAESGFYKKNFDLHKYDDLVLMMAYKFQSERFSLGLPREGTDTLPPEVVRVAVALLSHKVKLGATLARMRVKQNAITISQLIQDPQVRLRFQSAEHLHCSARVSSVKVKCVDEEIIPKLQSRGVSLVQTYQELHIGSVYQPRKDLLVFSADFRPSLYVNSLVEEGILVLQDLTSYFCVEQSMKTITERGGGDIIFTNCFSGKEVIHAASILGNKGTVLAFNVSAEMVDVITSRLLPLGLQNVQLICAPFVSSSPSEESMSKVRLVVCMPSTPLNCPYSTHPVDYVLQEGDSQLSSLGPRTGTNSPNTDTHTDEEDLSHALKFEQAKHIVFVSNDDNVNIRSVMEGSKTFSLVHGSPTAVGEGEEGLLKSSYTITMIKKNPSGPPPRAVLARAIASGLLDTDCLDEGAISPQKQISKKRKTRQARINALHQGIPLTSASSENKINKK